MSSATPVVKPLSMADSCLTSLSTHFTPKVSNYSSISFPAKPIKVLHLSSTSSSSSLPSWVSPKNKSSSSPVVTLVASTSDWALQEEEDEGLLAKLNEFEMNECSDDEMENEWYSLSETTLFVRNLPYDMDSDKVAQLFDQAGTALIATLSWNRDTNRSRGIALVTMSTPEEVEKAVEMFNGYDINGRLLNVYKPSPRVFRPERAPQEFEPSFRVYVGNLPWQADEARLEEVFSEHGKVVNVRVVYNLDTESSRGFGFVTMSSKTEADDAIAALDGQTMDGRVIRVSVAE